MKALVTGGAGFIGSHLVDRLVDEGLDVVVLDNLSGGRLEFLDRHLGSSAFEFIEGDVRDADALAQALGSGAEVVYHLAANADIARGAVDPTLDFDHSIVGTFALLQAMRDSDANRIVYTSGSGVYGDRGASYSAETLGPLRPVSMYGASKLAAEGLISAFCHLYGMRASIVRPANIIGPRTTHGVVFDFVRRLKADSTRLRILGDGQQSKAYLHVADVVDALLLVRKQTSETVSFFNLSSDSFVTVDEIAAVVLEAMGLQGVEVAHTGGTVGWNGDVAVVRLANDAIAELGWRPRFDSLAAVRATVGALLVDPRLAVPVQAES